jgi:hypothetical protein
MFPYHFTNLIASMSGGMGTKKYSWPKHLSLLIKSPIQSGDISKNGLPGSGSFPQSGLYFLAASTCWGRGFLSQTKKISQKITKNISVNKLNYPTFTESIILKNKNILLCQMLKK